MSVSDALPRKRRRLNSPGSSSNIRSKTRESPEPCQWVHETQIHTTDDDEKPIWRLYNFAFFDPSSSELAGLDELYDESSDAGRGFEGSGLALPVRLETDEWQEEEDDDSDSDDEVTQEPIPLRLGAIFSYHVDLGTEFAGDSAWQQETDNIWVQTQHAWYILGTPRGDYRAEYLKFYAPRRLAQLVVHAALNNPSWDQPAFAKRLARLGKDTVLNRAWTESDLRAQVAAIADVLETELGDSAQAYLRIALKSSPLINSFVEFDDGASMDESATESSLVITPVVHRLARPWFRLPWKVVGDTDSAVNSPESDHSFSGSRPPSPTATDIQDFDIELCEPCDDDNSTDQCRYLRMAWSGNTYRAHDTVKIRGESSLNSEYEWWYGRIAYFFEGTKPSDASRRIFFHTEWYDGAGTVLGLLGCAQELFAIEMCTDVCVDAIVGPPVTLGQPTYPLSTAPMGLFCSYLFSRASFVHLSRCAGRNILGVCFVCALRAQRAHERNAIDARYDHDVETCYIRGVLYHAGDFVFLRRRVPDKTDSSPFDGGVSPIAQVIRFTPNGKARIAILRRTGPNGTFGERELSFADKQKFVSCDEIVRRCKVSPERPSKDALDRDPWLFFLADSTIGHSGKSPCAQCIQEYEKECAATEEFDKYHSEHPLKMLDPYSGAGGLALGIERGSRCVKTRYAVDINRQATQTFAANHFDAIEFHTDANEFLAAVCTGSKIKDLQGTSMLPDLDIDIISAGVPCQGHSGLNMFRKAEDENNNQMLTALSLAEHYHPRYFILENVPAIINWRLMAQQCGVGVLKGGVEHGGLRLAISVLLALGYQVRVGLLQAGHYGTPQNRRRFFLVAANSKSTLPDFPQPTTAFASRRALRIPAHVFGTKEDAWEDHMDKEANLPPCVPHSFVSVRFALSDLHEFDWDPIRSFQRKDGTAVFSCTTAGGCIPSFLSPYARVPQNQYQVRARLNEPSSFSQLQHFTAGYPKHIVENVSNLSRDWDSDYRGVGRLRKRDFMLGDPLSSTGRHGFGPGIYYRRLDPDGVFSTLVTNIHPTAKQSRVILPTQSRLISVREIARGQGFPDTYEFKGTFRDMQRQLGNAVPVPLAEAIGRELRASMLRDWIDERVRIHVAT